MPNETCPKKVQELFKSGIIQFKIDNIPEYQKSIKKLLVNIFPECLNPNSWDHSEKYKVIPCENGEWFYYIQYFPLVSQRVGDFPAYRFLITNKTDINVDSFSFDITEQGNIIETKKVINKRETTYNSAWPEAYESVVKGLELFIQK